MVRKIFKKHKDNQNKIKPRGRKRQIFPTIVLALSLLFGKSRLSSSQSLSSNFYNQTIQERVINDRDINLFEDNDQQVILVKNNSSSPIVRPGLANGFSSKPRVNRPAGASGLKPVRANPVRGFNTPRGLITGQPVTGAQRQRMRLDGAGNPTGAGGGASSDDQCPVSKEQKSQESSTHHHDFTQKSKKKKKRNQHLNQQIEVNGEIFQFERDQIEKKAPSHGTDFGLDPDYGPDGKIIRDRKTAKSRAKQNKKKLRKIHR